MTNSNNINHIISKGYFMVAGTVRGSIVTRLMNEDERMSADKKRHYVREELNPVLPDCVQIRLSHTLIIQKDTERISDAERFGWKHMFKSKVDGSIVPCFTARYLKRTPDVFAYDESSDEYVLLPEPFDPHENSRVVIQCAYLNGNRGDFYRIDKVFLIGNVIHRDALLRACENTKKVQHVA